MKYEIKRLNVFSVAKVSFVLGGVFGFLAGLFLWVFAGMLAQLPLEGFGGDSSGMEGLGAFGIIMPFMLAVFYGVVTMIMNAILTLIYNLLAGLIGGLEMELHQVQQPVYQAPAAAGSYTPPPPAAPPLSPPQAPSPGPPPSTPQG